jgi:hypothetical protein
MVNPRTTGMHERRTHRNRLCAWGSNATGTVTGCPTTAVLNQEKRPRRAMERTGIEPVTSGLQSRRSPS